MTEESQAKDAAAQRDSPKRKTVEAPTSNEGGPSNAEAVTERAPKPRRSRGGKRRGAKVIALGRAAEGAMAKYPRHAVRAALRIPRGILDQNAGKECSDKEAAAFVGVKQSGPFSVELSGSSRRSSASAAAEKQRAGARSARRPSGAPWRQPSRRSGRW